MIVDENDRSGIEFERAPEDCPGIDRKLRKGSVLELLVSEEPPCPVEEQYAQHLDRKRTHRRDQILAQLRVEGVEIGRAHVELQSLMRISYAVFCLKKKKQTTTQQNKGSQKRR